MGAPAAPGPDQRLAEPARAQYGVVARRQLAAIGLGRRAVERRIASGRLHRIHLGVYAVGHTVLNRNARYLAAVLAAGDGAVLSHRSAAILWGIHRSDAAKIDVTIPRTCGFRSTRTIAVHRPRLAPIAMTRAGIRVTPPGRTLQDLATAVTWHDTADAFERDRVRDAQLTAAGWRVVRFTRRRVRTEPATVADLVRTLLPSLSLPSAVDVLEAQRA